MTEASMVRRVSRAICLAARDDPSKVWGSQEDPAKEGQGAATVIIHRQWQKYLPEARAAIEALREPTEAMTEAAYDAASCDDQWAIADAGDFAKAWRAAISEALK